MIIAILWKLLHISNQTCPIFLHLHQIYHSWVVHAIYSSICFTVLVCWSRNNMDSLLNLGNNGATKTKLDLLDKAWRRAHIRIGSVVNSNSKLTCNGMVSTCERDCRRHCFASHLINCFCWKCCWFYENQDAIQDSRFVIISREVFFSKWRSYIPHLCSTIACIATQVPDHVLITLRVKVNSLACIARNLMAVAIYVVCTTHLCSITILYVLSPYIIIISSSSSGSSSILKQQQ